MTLYVLWDILSKIKRKITEKESSSHILKKLLSSEPHDANF